MLGKTPEVRLPGLDATGFVLLRLIGELVLSQGDQTLATGNDPSLTSAEKASPFDLIGRDGSGALVGVSGLDVNALAVRVGGFRYAVGSDDILATLVALPQRR